MPVSNHTPSWKQGYARNAAQSAAPGLWKGLVGLWVPSLGPTGLTLRDISGFGSHGTLTSMDPATDWGTTSQRGIPWALDFDGDNDHVNAGGVTAATTSVFSYTVMFRTTDASSNVYILSEGLSSSNTPFAAMLKTENKLQFFKRNDASGLDINISSNLTINDGSWHVASCVASSTTAQIFIDGKPDAAPTAISHGATTLDRVTFSALGRIGVGNFWSGQVAFVAIHSRILALSENQQLYEKPMDMLRRLIQTLPAEVAVAGTILPQITSAYLRTNA